MLLYVLRRLLYTLPIAVGVSLVCFSLIHLAPGDPLSAVLPDSASPQLVAEVKAAYGFDQPLPIQYVRWLGHVATGDLGTSIVSRRPVLGEIITAVGNTLPLAALAILIGFLLGATLGVIGGYRHGSVVDRAASAVAITGISVPHYWLGMVLIIIFSVMLGLLPATGMGTDGLLSADTWRHALLPAFTMAVIPSGIIARSMRATIIEVRKQEYVQTLYAKGLTGRRVFVHIMKNAAPTVLAIMGLQFAHLLGGSILVETVFAWPGTGFLMNAAIFTRDLPLLQGTILVLSMFFVFTNVAVDILQMFVDPRLKRS
jgi:peptide/nickel transport system permease protein